VTGIPIQFTTDCGSETTILYGLISALRYILSSQSTLGSTDRHADKFYSPSVLWKSCQHMFICSVHNISIERSWLRLRLDFGDNAVLCFENGIAAGIYDPEDQDQYTLCQWLWSRFLNQELQEFITFRNSTQIRKVKNKPGPSSCSHNGAFSNFKAWGGENLMPILDLSIIREIKEAMGGDELLAFTSAEFSGQAQAAYDTLTITQLTMENVWDVFTAMHAISMF
ncbi:hypothetical protein C8J56DRAFT_785885, partial [Mycena floridula]